MIPAAFEALGPATSRRPLMPKDELFESKRRWSPKWPVGHNSAGAVGAFPQLRRPRDTPAVDLKRIRLRLKKAREQHAASKK
jgi:hypothetical protein